jgi:hypothetical protein
MNINPQFGEVQHRVDAIVGSVLSGASSPRTPARDAAVLISIPRTDAPHAYGWSVMLLASIALAPLVTDEVQFQDLLRGIAKTEEGWSTVFVRSSSPEASVFTLGIDTTVRASTDCFELLFSFGEKRVMVKGPRSTYVKQCAP